MQFYFENLATDFERIYFSVRQVNPKAKSSFEISIIVMLFGVFNLILYMVESKIHNIIEEVLNEFKEGNCVA